MASITELIEGVEFTLDFDLDPAAEEWHGRDGRFRAGPYELRVERQTVGDGVATVGWELRRDDGQPVTLRRLTVDYRMPLVDLYRLWPTSGIAANSVFLDLPWSIDAYSSAASYDPVLLGLNADGVNTFSVGFADTALETRISGKLGRSHPDAEAGFTSHVYHARFERPCVEGMVFRSEVVRDALFVSSRREEWFLSLGRYAAFVDQTRGFAGHLVRERALEPMWHSWYAFENEISQDRMESQIAPAKELGFGTMQLDAGWNTGREWTSEEGRYDPNRDRFPDFERLMGKIKDGGLVPVAHWSPPWLGARAPNRDALAPAVQGTTDFWRSQVDHLCPRTPATISHIVDSARHMVADLGFGGLWYDFVDSMPVAAGCDGSHEHVYETNGEAWTAILDACARAAWEADPDCLLIFRRSHANIHNKPYLTHLWPADAPFDYTKNRREVVAMRAYGRGVLTHACCTCWSPDESEAVVARHLASVVLAGVPAISIDLQRFPESHLDGIKRWLAFYRQHRHALMEGEMQPLVFMPPSAVVRVEGPQEAFVGYFEGLPGITPLTRRFDTLYLINCFQPDLVTRLTGQVGTYTVELFDHFLRPLDGQRRRLESSPRGLDIDLRTPVPAVVKLSRDG